MYVHQYIDFLYKIKTLFFPNNFVIWNDGKPCFFGVIARSQCHAFCLKLCVDFAFSDMMSDHRRSAGNYQRLLGRLEDNGEERDILQVRHKKHILNAGYIS